jgi:23S rRNA G2445 N2-methylase RlmL
VKKPNPDKERYQQLRSRSWDDLWNTERPAFDQADPAQRPAHVALVRALGVVASESGRTELIDTTRRWITGLLHDPAEKIRRYAINALPKLHPGPEEEAALLALFRTTVSPREKEALLDALEKIGGPDTLATLSAAHAPASRLQKVQAHVVRAQQPGRFCPEQILHPPSGTILHLHCRRGLERFARDETKTRSSRFTLGTVRPGCVTLQPTGPFSWNDLLSLRCHGHASLVLGSTPDTTTPSLAALIATSPRTALLTTATAGPVRYRVEFIGAGARRAEIRALTTQIHTLNPGLLNDPRQALWAIDIHLGKNGARVEARPRFSPDPRFSYRQADIPAASHPPLAAALAFLAGPHPDEQVWDPFCGSGLELIERVRLGGVRSLTGTDKNPAALDIARKNFQQAGPHPTEARFVPCDFRQYDTAGITPGSLTLLITNPPMGRRVPVPNLTGLIHDLFTTAATVLVPGGRLVFANPLPLTPRDLPLRLDTRQPVDFGGFTCQVEKYIRL